ncbi:helix-turn-helix domain-containing protein [Actinosynnema sp. ALI-1.44]|uniref:helix-turn-helix domain-containing protein n=1 Tax=Actinosynnema sp. ALI-1.44 TaxID=1933779 RepID=UPI001EDA2897|nr:helix-turn-helix domain-containing protein [Actinosynnema sp. ALI-1.44]
MADPVRVRRLSDQEGQRLQQIVRRGSTSSVRYRRAMMILASAGGNRVPVIAQLVQADEDTVREVLHRFNEIGLASLDPQWAGGRPRCRRFVKTGSGTVSVIGLAWVSR